MTPQPVSTPDTQRWPNHPAWRAVTIDYPASLPGVLEVDHIRATVDGGELPITRTTSSVFPGGWSISYPTQDALLAHLGLMRIYRAKLAALDQGDDTTDDVNTPTPTVERPVFGTRLTQRQAQHLARNTNQGELW